MELDPYHRLKLEFAGIRHVISSYFIDDLTQNQLVKMGEALRKDSIEEVLYLLDQMCNWYNRKIDEIHSNSFVENDEDHDRTKALLDELNLELKSYDFSNYSMKETMKETQNVKQKVKGSSVFIVHGHDTLAKTEVARFVEGLGLHAVILHEKPDEGKTIIEKLETYTADVAYAIVLYTECDLGRAKEKSEEENSFRARQNVVFEHGLFIGAIGRARVCALVKGKIEKPGDIDGVVYVEMDEKGAWMLQLCRNMKAAGLDIDLNKLA